MRCAHRAIRRLRNGFTLIEIICVLVLLGLMGIFGTQMLSTAVRGYTNARNADEIVQKAQMALQRMTVEFTYIIPTNMNGTANSIQYIDPSGIVGNHTISQSGTKLYYMQGGDNWTLLDGVAANTLSFVYYNTYANAGVSTAANNASINLVGISFTMQGDDASLGHSKSFSTRVKINKN